MNEVDLRLLSPLVFGAGMENTSQSMSAFLDENPRGWSTPQSSVSIKQKLFSLRGVTSLEPWLRIDSGVAGLPTDMTDRSSASSDGRESHEDDLEYEDRSSAESSVDSSNKPNDAPLLKLGLKEESFLHSWTSSSMDICLELWRLLRCRLDCVRLGGGIAVTASKAATAGGRESARCTLLEGRDLRSACCVRLLPSLLALPSVGLRGDGISTGLDGDCMLIMVDFIPGEDSEVVECR